MAVFDCLVSCSEADPTAPGTDKDIDYYQHKSTAADDFMPSRTGWEAVSDNKAVRITTGRSQHFDQHKTYYS